MLETVYAMFPDVREAVLRRIVAKLVRRGALVWCWAGELGCKVFLTTHGDGKHEAGVRRWLKDPEAVRRALETGSVGRVKKLPPKFIHNQTSGLVALGISGGRAEFERELWRQRDGAPVVADGAAWPEPDRRILVENERMVGQSPHRWEQKNGLADRIAKSFRESETSDGFHDEYIVIAPTFLSDDWPDSLRELEKHVAARVVKNNHKNRQGCGWWSLDPGALDADPVWHSFPADSGQSPRPLPGIRSRRLSFEADHKEAAEIDRLRKARRAALTAEERATEDRDRAEAKAKARKQNQEREAASPPAGASIDTSGRASLTLAAPPHAGGC
ncbi:MAG: hypothetical protein EPN45_02855 [Rhizobiaceae bacterium]|nr:MAG: hypothetical protein EPN45_02855 [Rhizobiaceae bacterium]